ncbi:DUF4123 domain-containing protein [Halopseudomonas laoshanensis]|nr:DUF4123 domain-containing protein [Halopseudomonas laoshanensis]
MHDIALANLPWHLNGYLLIDGISVESLSKKLYEWSDLPEFEVLYLETSWAELSDVSPLLVKLKGASDPILAEFLAHKADEWGYLLFSSKESQEVTIHLRKLISVEHPAGKAMLLRLADPAVANALFGLAAENKHSELFGPIDQLHAYDAISRYWHSHQRPGAKTVLSRLPYRLSENELAVLGEIDFRQTVRWLQSHMNKHFPHFVSEIPDLEQWNRIYQLADQAYQAGFTSERDIGLYANVFGFLGQDALEHHPDIAELVTKPNQQSPSQRIEQAANLAESRMALLERNPI